MIVILWILYSVIHTLSISTLHLTLQEQNCSPFKTRTSTIRRMGPGGFALLDWKNQRIIYQIIHNFE